MVATLPTQRTVPRRSTYGASANHATLVLVKRFSLGPGDPANPRNRYQFDSVELIDSVEILTGGASSVYGADAVAGVVNFKLNDHLRV